ARSCMISLASAPGFPGGTSTPAPPARTSHVPPTAVATTGRRAAIASRRALDIPSAFEGRTKTSMAASARRTSASLPVKRTISATPSSAAWRTSSARRGPALTRDPPPGAARARIVAGQAPLARQHERHAGQPRCDRAHQRRTPLVAVDDLHAVGAERGGRADDRPRGAHGHEARSERERDDVDACGAQLGLDLAARDEGIDARGDARAIEPAEHLLEVPLRP